eukprot:3752610-Rhodomonas_salina.1
MEGCSSRGEGDGRLDKTLTLPSGVATPSPCAEDLPTTKMPGLLGHINLNEEMTVATPLLSVVLRVRGAMPGADLGDAWRDLGAGPDLSMLPRRPEITYQKPLSLTWAPRRVRFPLSSRCVAQRLLRLPLRPRLPLLPLFLPLSALDASSLSSLARQGRAGRCARAKRAPPVGAPTSAKASS